MNQTIINTDPNVRDVSPKPMSGISRENQTLKQTNDSPHRPIPSVTTEPETKDLFDAEKCIGRCSRLLELTKEMATQVQNCSNCYIRRERDEYKQKYEQLQPFKNAQGKKRRSKRVEKAVQEIDKILNWRAEKMPLHLIANRYKISKSTLGRIIKEHTDGQIKGGENFGG